MTIEQPDSPVGSSKGGPPFYPQGWVLPKTFYLVCYSQEGTVWAAEQPIVQSNFQELLDELLHDETEEVTYIIACTPEGTYDASKEFAKAWWDILAPTFLLGRDKLPAFISTHLEEVAFRHWAEGPQRAKAH